MDTDGRGTIITLLSVGGNTDLEYSAISIVLLIIFMAFLLCAGAYFAGTETAFASVSRTRIKTLADGKDARAKKALFAIENFDKALITILIGNNISHIGFSTIATLLAQKVFQSIPVSVMTLITTFIVFFLAEMIPKSYSKSNSEKVALKHASSLRFIMTISTPLCFVFLKISVLLSKIFVRKSGPTLTEEELSDIIETMDEEGSFENEDKSELLQNAMEFDDLTAEDILTSRVDLDCIDINDDINGVLEFVKNSNHSRIPVYNKSVDNIVGVLRTRRFLKAYIKTNGNVNIKNILSTAYFVPHTTKIDDLFERMTQNKQYLSIITDEYGGTMGIVTIEDIVEELVGDIWDESDEAVEGIIKTGDNKYTVLSDVLVEDFLYETGREIDDEQLSRISFGALCSKMLESVPKKGDCFSYSFLNITVKDVEHNRVLSLEVEVTPRDEGDDGYE